MGKGDSADDPRLHGTDIADCVVDLIGNTPMVKLGRIGADHVIGVREVEPKARAVPVEQG